MEDLIGELNVTILKQDPNNSLRQKVNTLIRDGKRPGDKRPLIANHAPNAPRLFGRLKDHKQIQKTRPIVNKKEGPTYSLEKYMKGIYEQILPESKIV